MLLNQLRDSGARGLETSRVTPGGFEINRVTHCDGFSLEEKEKSPRKGALSGKPVSASRAF